MRCGRASRSFGVVLCAALLALPELVNGAGPVGPSKERSVVPMTEQDFVDSVNEKFSLRASTLFTLEVAATAAVPIRITIPIEGRQRTIVLHHHSIRAPEYQLLMQVADGSLVSVEPGPERTLRGVVEGVPGSVVAASLEDAGIQAVVRWPDGEQYWIEPLAGKVVAALPGEHVIYRASDSLHDHNGSCGCTSATAAALAATAKPAQLDSGSGPVTTATAAVGGPTVAELACDADFEYFVSWESSVINVQNRISSVMNAVNMQYERDVNITHQITAIVVRTDVDDPYTATNTDFVVNEFRAEWNANMNHIPRDVAQLFTAREIDGSVIGQAFTIGGVCNLNQAYCYVQSDFASGIFQYATDLSAHELGHLWNAFHCNCTNPDFTMNPGITGANRFQPIDSIPFIQGYRSTSATAPPGCLDNRQPPPANDACVDATPVCAGAVFGSTDWADNEGIPNVPGPDDCDSARTSPDVWYSYTPAVNGNLSVTTCGEIWDTMLAIHSDCPEAISAHTIDCVDDDCGPGPFRRQSTVDVNVTAGTTYYIRVTGWNIGFSPSGPAEEFELNITGPPCVPFCGDGNCDAREDRCNCSSDCGTSPASELACDDGIDNDCDSLTDCDDADCLTAPNCSCVPTEILEISCDDGVDNDCDGLVDCDDLEACGPRPVGPCVAGDADCDSDADQADYAALVDDFGGPGVITFDCSPFDVDLDLDLDLLDVAAFQNAFSAVK
ncbi:MAG: hypothetical protein IH897_08485 [Planctomycetes bacterium]|nr:hypothetical protein [Planctomycetota bacterium]